VFHQHSDHPWTGWGYLARVTLAKGEPPRIEVCPYHLLAAVPQPLTAAQEPAFWAHFEAISRAPGAGRRAERAEDGCTRIVAGR
jgi:hypothetical protein